MCRVFLFVNRVESATEIPRKSDENGRDMWPEFATHGLSPTGSMFPDEFATFSSINGIGWGSVVNPKLSRFLGVNEIFSYHIDTSVSRNGTSGREYKWTPQQLGADTY